MNDKLFEIFERTQDYIDLKEKKNPLIKGNDRSLEMAYREMTSSVRNFEKFLMEIEEDLE